MISNDLQPMPSSYSKADMNDVHSAKVFLIRLAFHTLAGIAWRFCPS